MTRLLVTHLAIYMIAVGVLFTGHGLYIRAKAVVAQILLDEAWTTTLATGQPTKAWNWADTWPIARIEFPRLNQTAIVLKEAGGEALAFGPAHVAASPMPGEPGTTVIAAHRDTHFSFIKDLKPGDEIDVTTPDGKTIRYWMTGSAIVHAQASGIATEGKTHRLALVTCYPFDGLTRGPLRYVVFAEARAPSSVKHFKTLGQFRNCNPTVWLQRHVEQRIFRRPRKSGTPRFSASVAGCYTFDIKIRRQGKSRSWGRAPKWGDYGLRHA